MGPYWHPWVSAFRDTQVTCGCRSMILFHTIAVQDLQIFENSYSLSSSLSFFSSLSVILQSFFMLSGLGIFLLSSEHIPVCLTLLKLRHSGLNVLFQIWFDHPWREWKHHFLLSKSYTSINTNLRCHHHFCWRQRDRQNTEETCDPMAPFFHLFYLVFSDFNDFRENVMI